MSVTCNFRNAVQARHRVYHAIPSPDPAVSVRVCVPARVGPSPLPSVHSAQVTARAPPPPPPRPALPGIKGVPSAFTDNSDKSGPRLCNERPRIFPVQLLLSLYFTLRCSPLRRPGQSVLSGVLGTEARKKRAARMTASPLSIPFIPAPATGTPSPSQGSLCGAGTALQLGPNKTPPSVLRPPPFKAGDLSQVFFHLFFSPFFFLKARLFLGIFSQRLK